MEKAEVAEILDQIATMLELQGENPFRARAYSAAARTIAQLESNLADVVEAGELDSIPGIGETLRDKITLLVQTGKLPFYDDLKAKTPPGLFQMMKLQGLGPKKIKTLHTELGIDTIELLKKACEEDRIAKLKGFGAKTQANLLEGIAFLDLVSDRVRIDQAQFLAEQVVELVRKMPGILRLEICGSLRRRRETVKDIDLLVSSDDAGPIMKAFVEMPIVQRILGHGETKSSVIVSVLTAKGERITMNADLRIVTDEQFPFAQNYFTGSKEHNVAMRRLAIEKGWKLNEYGLVGPGAPKSCKDEAALYRALGLAYVEPTLREDTGELIAAASNSLPKLIELDDLTGCFHCHTNWSDGANTLEEMAAAAQKLGFQYLGIGDHSQSLTVANGLTPDRVRQQHTIIDKLNVGFKGFRLFKGIECDILADGSLDYEDDVLASFDYVVASVHSHFNQPQAEMTARICRALSNPHVTMLGHATGRLILRRDGYKVDLDAVIRTALEHGKMIEINADPHRLDLDWIHSKIAHTLGVMLVINPDAHSTEGLKNVRFGIDVARRAWLEKGVVFNTRSLAQVVKAFKK